jgi:hypothetical protein
MSRGGRAGTIAGVPESRPHPHTLIVYVNHAVGTALVHRLMGDGVVTVGSVAGALEALEGPERYEAVVACPYLADAELDAVLAACRARTPVPALVRLADAPGAEPTISGPMPQRAMHRLLEALA